MFKDINKRIVIKYLELELVKLNTKLEEAQHDTLKSRQEIQHIKEDKEILSDKIDILLTNVSIKNNIIEVINAFEKVLEIIKNN